MIPMKAGELRNSVELYDVPGETLDDYGQVTDTPSLIGTFRAKIENLKGRELQAAMQDYTSVTHRVTMWWLGSAIPATAHNPNGYILPRMYLNLRDGRRLDVVYASNTDELNYQWVLMANEKVVT
jgi:head-tail adaptor